MQHALVDVRLPGGCRPRWVRHVQRAGSWQTPAKLLVIVLQALLAALWRHRRYQQLRSRGIAHEAAIRQALLGEARD